MRHRLIRLMVILIFAVVGGSLMAAGPPPGKMPRKCDWGERYEPELRATRLELLKEAAPSLARVAVLWCPERHVNRAQWREAHVAARVLGLTLQSLAVRGASDFAAVFRAAARGSADASLILDGPLFGSEVVQQELLSGRPGMCGSRGFVRGVGLMACCDPIGHRFPLLSVRITLRLMAQWLG